MQNTLFLIAAIVAIAAVGVSFMLYLGPKREDVEKIIESQIDESFDADFDSNVNKIDNNFDANFDSRPEKLTNLGDTE